VLLPRNMCMLELSIHDSAHMVRTVKHTSISHVCEHNEQHYDQSASQRIELGYPTECRLAWDSCSLALATMQGMIFGHVTSVWSWGFPAGPDSHLQKVDLPCLDIKMHTCPQPVGWPPILNTQMNGSLFRQQLNIYLNQFIATSGHLDVVMQLVT